MFFSYLFISTNFLSSESFHGGTQGAPSPKRFKSDAPKIAGFGASRLNRSPKAKARAMNNEVEGDWVALNPMTQPTIIDYA